MINKKTIGLVLKITVSILLLYYILSKIEWDEAIKNMERAEYLPLVVVFFLFFLERVGYTYKLNLLLWARGIKITFWRLFLINSIGAFGGLFLPSSLSTDVVRSLYLVRNNSEKSVSISSILVDRLLGILALLLLCLISLILGGDLISKLNIEFYVIIILIVFLIFLYLFQKEGIINFLHKLLLKIKYKSITEKIVRLHLSILEYRRYPKTLFLAFLFTFLVFLIRVLIYYLISLAFNIPIHIIYFFIIVPILTFVIMIPISIGGLGVGEGVFITFFSLVGISINDSIVIALTCTLANTIFTLLGGLALLFYKVPAKKDIVLGTKSGAVNSTGK